MKSYAIIAKPIGPICNLDCRYCYYNEKKSLYPESKSFRMTIEVLESFIKQYIEAQGVPEIQFVWQGGEPTLMGVDFFREVIRLQNQYSAGKKISNAIQTNGILLNDEWFEFLTANQFLVGVSVDGPERFHDHYRRDFNNKPTFEKVLRSIERLKQHGTSFNTVTVLHNMNVQYPLEVYQFLKDIGEGFIQFIPIIERTTGTNTNGMDLILDSPPNPTKQNDDTSVTQWSIKPNQFADFYIHIFNEWIIKDVGDYFVQFFDVALNNWMEIPSPLCTFSKSCRNSGALEHNGDIYACDHYVYPEYKLGNIMESDIARIMVSQKDIGPRKIETLPGYCKKCEYFFACNGGCPKHRFIESPDGETGLNYLCPAYKKTFKHMSPYLDLMKKLLQSGRPAYLIKDYINKHPALNRN
ncbi:MAG: anaerobic sulfatase maturase [Desulfobacterales bacterium]|nr:anaerobic sulfatase maturase [Desulfobacterales bacterium]